MIFGKMFYALRRALTEIDRDRIDAKFDHLDERIDRLEQSNAEIRVKIDSINSVNFANNEVLEQKLNASKSGQERILSIMELRFSYAEDALKDIKNLITKIG
jgi:prefoldin subunit 5